MPIKGEQVAHKDLVGGGFTVMHRHGVFPVNSIFIATVGTNPAILLGYGVWSLIYNGRFPGTHIRVHAWERMS